MKRPELYSPLVRYRTGHKMYKAASVLKKFIVKAEEEKGINNLILQTE